MIENKRYLSEQIITYLGNKRRLLGEIENEVTSIKDELGKDSLITADIFSGSGIVARMLKQYSSIIYTNDMEKYSCIINDCYLSNKQDIDWEEYGRLKNKLDRILDDKDYVTGVISENYSPEDDNDIKEGERVFYTNENARIIDTTRKFISENVSLDMQPYFLAPLLYEASVHVNTSGVFKGFYKSKVKNVGKFGGEGENALDRIMGKITIQKPVLSNFYCIHHSYQMDSNELVTVLPECDVIYIDPPYNQHPYGSNYFMLNTIIENHIGNNISKVAGIPDDWNKSSYNKRNDAIYAMSGLIKGLNTKYAIVSYSSDGFISYDEMMNILSNNGEVRVKEIVYPTFRGSRNLQNREKHVKEYIFTIKMK